jgi:Ribbon-helix-helix protein, copG family
MTTPAHDLVLVQTRIEPDLAEQLDVRRRAADRSVAAEVRQAIRAWVGADSEQPLDQGRASVA